MYEVQVGIYDFWLAQAESVGGLSEEEWQRGMLVRVDNSSALLGTWYSPSPRTAPSSLPTVPSSYPDSTVDFISRTYNTIKEFEKTSLQAGVFATLIIRQLLSTCGGVVLVWVRRPPAVGVPFSRFPGRTWCTTPGGLTDHAWRLSCAGKPPRSSMRDMTAHSIVRAHPSQELGCAPAAS